MAIPEEIKGFISGLVDYYVSTAPSYRDLAGSYVDDSVDEVALGMIAGGLYSSFMQAYKNDNKTPSLEDVKEFNSMIRDRAPEIKKAIAGPAPASMPE